MRLYRGYRNTTVPNSKALTQLRTLFVPSRSASQTPTVPSSSVITCPQKVLLNRNGGMCEMVVLTWWIIQSGGRGTMVFVNSGPVFLLHIWAASKKTENICSVCVNVTLPPKHVPYKCMLRRFQDLSSAQLSKLMLRSWVFLSHSNWR